MDDYLKSFSNFCKLFAYVAENEKEELQYCSITLRTIGDYLYYFILLLVKLFVVLCCFIVLPFIGDKVLYAIAIRRVCLFVRLFVR